MHLASFENWTIPAMKDHVKKASAASSTASDDHYTLSEAQGKAVLAIWTSSRDKIHASRVKASHFTKKTTPKSTLSTKPSADQQQATGDAAAAVDGEDGMDIKWRLDQLSTNAKDLSEVSSLVAIVELPMRDDKKLVFEVDKQTLAQVVDQLNQIQQRIEQLSV